MGMWRLYPSETLLQILHLSKMQTEKGQKFALIQINKLICLFGFLSTFGILVVGLERILENLV